MKISLKSEISKKYEKILLSQMVLLESVLIYTYSGKFLLKMDESVEKIFDLKQKIFWQFAVKIRNLENNSRKLLAILVFR